MKRYGLLLMGCCCLGLTALPAVAQNMTIRGGFGGGSNASEVVEAIDSEWSDGGFDCHHGSPTLIVSANTGTCKDREVTLFFEVTSGGGVTNQAHPFEYHVACGAGNRITHDIGFAATCSIGGAPCTVPTDPLDDPPEPGNCPPGQGNCVVTGTTNIDSGVFTFNLSGGDTIRITTNESVTFTTNVGGLQTNVPALGEWGAIIVGGGIVALAVWLMLRRRSVEPG